MTLKMKFLLSFVLGTACAMLAVAMVGYFFTKEQTMNASRLEMTARLDMQSARTDGWLKSKFKILETTGTLLRNTVSNDALSASHLQSFRLDPDVSDVYIGLTDGRFFDGADWPAPPGYDPRQQAWYLQAQDKVGISVTAPYLDKVANRQVVSFVLPLRSPLGKLRGVLGAEVQLSALSNYTHDVAAGSEGYSFIIDKNGVFIAHPNPSLLGTQLQDQPDLQKLAPAMLTLEEGSDSFNSPNGRHFLQFRKLPATGWTMAITMPEADVYRSLNAMKLQFVITTLLVMLLISSLTLLLYHHFVAPLVDLGQKALLVAEGDLSVRADRAALERNDEVGQLTASFNEMLANVVQREQERIRQLEQGTSELLAVNERLQTANQELTAALDQLHQTQGQLIESEKMAALGNLVAGIAHEINTPIGVGVTAASHLAQTTDAFLALYEQGSISRQGLADYLTDNREAAKILLTNLDRAARLVRNLKQVSLDQANESIRTFCVKDYLDEILLSLHPKLKKTKHNVTVDCPPDLQLTTYPGAFAQVTINLIINSLTHAFGAGDAGQIRLQLCRADDMLLFTYSDDGCGMDNATLSRIYEPFFTTKRGNGGSGLGLYLLYNIVSQQLQGTVRCTSQPGRGTQFLISLPLALPQPDTTNEWTEA